MPTRSGGRFERPAAAEEFWPPPPWLALIAPSVGVATPMPTMAGIPMMGVRHFGGLRGRSPPSVVLLPPFERPVLLPDELKEPPLLENLGPEPCAPARASASVTTASESTAAAAMSAKDRRSSDLIFGLLEAVGSDGRIP